MDVVHPSGEMYQKHYIELLEPGDNKKKNDFDFNYFL